MLEHDINDLIAVVHVAWLLRVSCYGHANNRLIVRDCKLSLFACYLVPIWNCYNIFNLKKQHCLPHWFSNTQILSSSKISAHHSTQMQSHWLVNISTINCCSLYHWDYIWYVCVFVIYVIEVLKDMVQNKGYN